MRTAVIKNGLFGMLLAFPLCSFADTVNADLIAGYTTQQIADALPKSFEGLQQRNLEVAADFHTFQAEYVDPTSMRKALVTLFTLPADQQGKIPVASSDQDLGVVVASAEKEMLRQRIKPDQKTLTGALNFRCLQTVMQEKVVHQVCSTLYKGRVLEVQPVFMVNDKAFAPAMQQGEALVLEFGKIMVDALK